jgi:hypothetical protein
MARKGILNGIKQMFAKKEIAEPQAKEDVSDKLASLLAGLKGGLLTDAFAEQLFADEKLNTHDEKARCKQVFRESTLIQAASNNLVNAILGDNPHIVSKDEKLENYANNYFLDDTGFRRAEREALSEAVHSGDGYIEVVKNDSGATRFFSIENAEDMFIDWDYETSKERRYILRFNVTEEQAQQMKLKSFTLIQPYGAVTFYGEEYEASKIIRYKFGNDTWGVYGRSPIAAALTDVKILKIMERAVGVIARYKAVPRRILMPDNNTEEGTMTQPEIEAVKNQLQEAGDTKTPFIGKKVSQLETGNGGKDIDLNNYLGHFKRKITIMMTPEFIMFGENSNRATSREQKQVYYLAVSAIRGYFLPTSNKAIFDGLINILATLKDKGVLKINLHSFRYQYGEFAVELPEEKQQRLMDEWNNGLILLSEYRRERNYPDIEDTAVFSWEVKSAPAPTGAPAQPQQPMDATDFQKLGETRKKLSTQRNKPKKENKKDGSVSQG